MPLRILKNITGCKNTRVYLTVCLSLFCVSSFGQANKKTDTLKLAQKLVSEKKFTQVNHLLSAYRKTHAKDFEATFLQAQTELWANNFRKSGALYNSAMRLQPDNQSLKISYIEFLLDLGKFDSAGHMLTTLEEDGEQSADVSLLMAKLYYWQGKYPQAKAYISKRLQQDGKNSEANALNEEIMLASAPRVSLSTGYAEDNQPYKALTSTLKFEHSFHRLLSLYVQADDYRFMQSKASDAQKVTIGDRLFFPKAGLNINAGGGMVKYAYKGLTDWTANLSINKKLTQQFNLELAGERGPYFDTKTSIDTNINAVKLSAKLNWSKRYWKAQLAYLNSTYVDDNYVNTAYAWILAPVEITGNAQFHLGYSVSYSNAYDSRYSSTASVSEILSHYPDLTISGLYQPYFTPRNLWVNSVIATLHAKLSKKVDLHINTDLGYATISNPYLYLTNSNGEVTIKREFTTAFFKPFNATVSFGYHITNTWLLTARYMYKSNYFYTSNYGGIGIEKSFVRNKKATAEKTTKSAYLNKVRSLEDKLRALYACKDEDELKREVAKITNELTVLRDEQAQQKKGTEMLPESEQSSLLDERYESLNEMIDEINSVDLNDAKEAANKHEWLVRKVYHLTSITYTGNTQE